MTLRRPFGPLFVRCDVCRRYARLYLADIRDADYRTKTFSCCGGGADGALARLTGPPKPAHCLSAKQYWVKAPTR
jgi:hypothetical protein